MSQGTYPHVLAGAPPTTDRRLNTSIRFPVDLHKALTIAAREREVSVNFLVMLAVREFLADLLPVDEIKWTR